MKDMVPKGTGNSRFLRSSIPENITYEELVALLRSGKFPVDFAGLNLEGIATQGSAYNKANVLPDSTCSTLELPTSAEPKDAFEHAALPEYSLRVGDIIISERDLQANFIPMDGRTISMEIYPDLYSLIGIKYGFGAVVNKTLGLGSSQNGNGGATVQCDDDGNFAVIIDLEGYERYEDVYIGKISQSEAKILKTYKNPSDFSQYRSSVAFGDDYIYVVQVDVYDRKYIFTILKKDGTELVKDSNGQLPKGAELNLIWSKGELYIFASKDYNTTVFKLNAPASIGYTQLKTLSGNPPVVYSNMGVCNGHYFWNNKRDGSDYSMGGISSSNDYLCGIQQCRDGSLYLATYTNSGRDTIKIFKTTNGTSFTLKFTLKSTDFRPTGGFWQVMDETFYYFRTDTKKAIRVDTNGNVSEANPPNMIQDWDDNYPKSWNMVTSNGFIIPYGKDTSYSVMLADLDTMFKLPDLSSIIPIPRIKAKAGDVG